MSDLRYALRTLARNPGFATVAIVTLALGIGANTAIFSVVNGVLLRPLPFPDADRIVRVWTTTTDAPRDNHAAGDFVDLQRENQSLAAIAGYREDVFTAVTRPGEPRLVVGAHATVDFFDVLGVPAALGRTFNRSQNDVAGEPMVVLGHDAWRQLFGESPDAVGQRLRLNGEPHTVLGIMPRGTEWPANVEIWVLSRKEVPPSPVESNDQSDRGMRYFEAIARLKDGLSLEQAQLDMKRMAGVLQQRAPQSAQPRGIELVPLREEIVGDVRLALLVMQAAVGLVLLIACANVSSLLIARATGRQRELAVRAALGAGRGRLIRQLLTESLVLGVTGGFCGLLLGAWLIVLLTGQLPSNVPRTDQIGLDRIVATVTLITALATGVLFGVMPALQASRADAAVALKRSGERGSASRARARSALVVGEVALTLILLAGAGLLLNSLLRLQRVESGFRPENVTLVSIVVPQSRYATGASQTELYRRLLEGLSRHGEVEATGVGFPGPLRGSNAGGAFFIEGHTADPADRPYANIGSVSGGFFDTLGIPIVAGRNFNESDPPGKPRIAIASVAMARKYWPGENAVGKRLRFDDTPETEWLTIVGIAGDARQLGLHRDAPPILYIPYNQFALPFTNIAVRSSAPVATVGALIRAELSAIDPELPPGENLASLQSILDRSMAQPRFRAVLISTFAVIALVLAAVGVFGLISYSVTQRTREIGIRIALGAGPGQVLRPMVREGLVLAAMGVGFGLIGALLVARVIASFLYGVDPTDPVTFGAVAGLLLGVAFLATYIPARRVLHVDPVSALRTE